MRNTYCTAGRSPLCLGLVAVLLLGAAGCAKQATVTGRIKYKDKYLGGGIVVFSVGDKGGARADIGEDGSYRLDKVPVGHAIITVETKSLAPTPFSPKAGPNANVNVKPPPNLPPEAANNPLYGGGGQKKGTYVPIPDKYGDPTLSGLFYDVQPGPQEHDIDLPP
jgi:hypothetical protein